MPGFLFFIFQPLLSNAKVMLQGGLVRKHNKTLADTVLINAWIFAAVTLIMGALFFRQLPPIGLVLLAILGGALASGFQICYSSAFRSGPISITCVIVSFAVVFPVLGGLLIYDEKLSTLRIAALVLTAITFLLIPERTGGKVNRRWLIFSLSAMVCSGTSNFLQLIVSRTAGFADYSNEFIVLCFAVASALCFLIGTPWQKRDGGIFHPTKKVLLTVLGIGLALGLYNILTPMALKSGIDASKYFPLMNVIIMIVVLISDFIFYRHIPKGRQWIGIVTAIIGSVLINL